MERRERERERKEGRFKGPSQLFADVYNNVRLEGNFSDPLF